ncbi:MAG: hypothetical protein JWN06_452 [Propionibacteriaceae bacterium]|nr:hypothetical protein [Propionibacteriaceae bacterium]
MTYVACEQLRYTWAERRLDGSGAGFGVVLQSRGWPAQLMQDPELRQVLTELSLAARRVSPDGPEAFLTHLRRAGGSLLVAKGPVGTDGAGRPGNYCVHALFDPTCTLGTLDLEPLLASGTFRLEREVDSSPEASAEPLRLWVSEDWSDRAERLRGGRFQEGGRGPARATRAATSQPDLLRHWDVEDLHQILQELVRTMPADLVNQTEVLGGQDAGPSGGTQTQPAEANASSRELSRSAAELGAADQPMWWQRRGLIAADWESELDEFIVLNQPVHKVPDERLWYRWDRSDATGRWDIANELLHRPGLVREERAAAAVASRPSLVDDITEAGLVGDADRRSAAARWVAEVGSDAQVIDLAAELLSAGPMARLPPTLVDRLTQLGPEDLPAVVADGVMQSLDGSASLPAAWRVACLRSYLLGRPGCPEPQRVADACSDEELTDAMRDAADSGGSLDESWERLSDLVPAARRDRSFAAASKASADYLLTHAATERQPTSGSYWEVLWPLVAVTSGWSPAVRDLLPHGRRRERRLRAQRLALLVTAALLAVTVVVLVVLLLVRAR